MLELDYCEYALPWRWGYVKSQKHTPGKCDTNLIKADNSNYFIQ